LRKEEPVTTMRAVVMEGAGGPEVLRIGEAERPSPGTGQVLLRVAATSVNRADTQQRMGSYPPPPGESEILGLEAAGVIESLGESVKGFRRGERVMTLLGGGGYAEFAVAPASTLIRIPDGIDFVHAAATTEVFVTAWLNVFREARLGEGETLLVHGGASGVGTAAIQLAKALRNARVLVTVGSEDKARTCQELGADHAILYKEQAFSEKVLELTDGRGADVILDHIGGDYLEPNLACLALYGRLVIIGLLGGPRAELNIGRLMVKRQRVIGSVLRARPVEEKAEITRNFEREVMPLLADGRVRPVIHEVMPLEDARRAHEAMAANANTGKLILVVDPDLAEATGATGSG
jgi:NADPH2:quinone reductase